MPLTDEKILRLARANLARLAAASEDAGVRHQFAAIDSALHELSLRADTDTEREWYRRGHALAKEGVTMLPPGSENRVGFSALLADVPPDTGSNAYQRELAALMACLRQIVHALVGAPDAASSNYLERVVAWEFELNTRRGGRADAINAAAVATGITQAGLEDYLRKRFPQRANLRVSQFEVLAGGYSKRTIFFTIEDDGGQEELVIRANQPSKNIKIAGADVRHEYPILQMAWKSGQMLPEPLWLEADDTLFGVCFLVCRKAAGRTIGSGHTNQTFQTITPAIKSELVRQMLKIHATPIEAGKDLTALAHWLPHRDLRSTAVASVDFWMQEVRDHDAVVTPTMQRLHDWLLANVPAPAAYQPVFIHGDFGLHNILFEGEKISSILDWEIAKIGDPAEEFIPLFMSLATDYDEDLVREYVAGGGQPVSRFRVTWYVLLIVFRVLQFDLSAQRSFELNENPDMNLFNWLTGTSPVILGNINALIAKAERERAEEASAA